MVQYPKGQSRFSNTVHTQAKTNYGSRGMFLENLLNQTNEFYRLKKRAVIHKKPTPVQVVKVHYPQRSAAVISEAYYRHASTTDYNGIYRGYYIDFEAKETKNKSSFPLKNLHEHQIQHMRECYEQSGIVFIIFYFSTLQKFYLLEFQELERFLTRDSANRQSLPLEYIQQFGYPLSLTIQSTLDYLSVIDTLIEKT